MKVLSLFANVGFGEFFFEENGLEVVVANELLQNRVDLYKRMYPKTKSVICGDICDEDIQSKIISDCQKFGPIDLIVATPPCQGMSVANATKKLNDPRNKLIVHAMEIFNKVGARYMLIENVPQMPKTFIYHKGKAVNIVDYINSVLPKNYKCISEVLNAKNYGTPQSRKRSISLISKDFLGHAAYASLLTISEGTATNEPANNILFFIKFLLFMFLLKVYINNQLFC